MRSAASIHQLHGADETDNQRQQREQRLNYCDLEARPVRRVLSENELVDDDEYEDRKHDAREGAGECPVQPLIPPSLRQNQRLAFHHYYNIMDRKQQQ